jgi:hypothetical protein
MYISYRTLCNEKNAFFALFSFLRLHPKIMVSSHDQNNARPALTTSSWRVQPRGGHSKNSNTASLLRHQESANNIIVQKRHRQNPASRQSDDDHDHDNGELPLVHRNRISNNNNNHPNNNHDESTGKKRKLPLYYVISLLLLLAFRIISGSVTTLSHNDALLASNNSFTNPFIARYDHALHSNNLGSELFIPLLYEHDKLLCRRKHKSQLSRYRTRYFAQMVRTGIAAAVASKQQPQQQQQPSDDIIGDNKTSFHSPTPNSNSLDDDADDDGLPILVMDGDDNGCNIQQHTDTFTFPRLTWSDLSSKHFPNTRTTTTTTTNTTTSSSSCNTISMPSYETYKYYHQSHRTFHDWERTFATNAHNYPWTTKIPKAVWRGSTTYEGSQYTGSELHDTPRGRLVLIGKEHTGIMDVGFHKIIQQYANVDRVELAKRGFKIKGRMHPMDMMKYKGMCTV